MQGVGGAGDGGAGGGLEDREIIYVCGGESGVTVCTVFSLLNRRDVHKKSANIGRDKSFKQWL